MLKLKIYIELHIFSIRNMESKPKYVRYGVRMLELIEDYDIIKGVELLGQPLIRIYDRTDKLNLRMGIQHILEEVNSPEINRQKFQDSGIKKALSYLNKLDLDEYVIMARKVVTSPVKLIMAQCSYKLNEHSGALNALDTFIYLSTAYNQAYQLLSENKSDNFAVRGAVPFIYEPTKNLILSQLPDGFNGLAQVMAISQEVDLKEYFLTPADINPANFSGDFTSDGLANKIFQEHLRNKVTEKVEEIEDLKKTKIKGILLSQIEVDVCRGIYGDLFKVKEDELKQLRLTNEDLDRRLWQTIACSGFFSIGASYLV